MECGPTTIGSALAEFLDDCLIAGKSPNTVTSYRYKISGRLDLDAPLTSLDSTLLRSILTEETRTKAPATAATLGMALRSFGRWCAAQGYLPINPAQHLPKPKLPPSESKSLSEPQVAALWAACLNDDERLLLAMLLGTGGRRSEIAGATMADVAGDTLRLFGKGRKVHRVLLPRQAIELLASRTNRGSILGLNSKALYRRFKSIAARAGMPWAWPHLCRHTYFTRAIQRGMSFTAAVQLGGWTDDRMLKSTYARSAMEDAALDEARRLMEATTRSASHSWE